MNETKEKAMDTKRAIDADYAKDLAETLLIFAEFFKFPTEKFYEEIASGELDRRLKALSERVSCPLNPHFEQHLTGYSQLIEEFNACFLGIQKPFAPPVESVYKPWTTDESFQVPFKNQTGYLMGDSAKHIEHILRGLQLEIPPEFHLMPDHLTIILELLAYFVARGLWTEAYQFQSDHLDWLADFEQRLRELNRQCTFYIEVVRELRRFLKDFQKKSRQQAEVLLNTY